MTSIILGFQRRAMWSIMTMYNVHSVIQLPFIEATVRQGFIVEAVHSCTEDAGWWGGGGGGRDGGGRD